MIPPPPRPTLFPTRRSSDLATTIGCFTSATNPIEYTWSALISIILSQISRRLSNVSALRQAVRSEEHTSELQSHVISYAVFCLKKKKHQNTTDTSQFEHM